jgi:putative membrane-bound dehydrogenase-like protein
MIIHHRLKSGPALVVFAVAVAIAAGLGGIDGGDAGAQAPPKDGDAAERDYAAELPRMTLKEPAEAQQALVVRPGFRVELAAAEPLLRSPVAMDFDEDGRLYVAEFPEYNEYADAKPHGSGCVRLLESTRGDGVYDRSTLFADGLPRATAVGCWDGGIYVGSSPELLYLKDTDGDGKADVRRVVFTGFGRDVAGEGMLNSFRWGLDHRIQLSTGGDGGEVSTVARPEARVLSVRGQGLRFDPRTETLELTGGGGQYGMSLDDWGRRYVCGNSNPFFLVMYDSRYLARNPYVQAPPAAVDVAPAGKYTKLYRISPVEAWRALRTRLRSQGIVPGSDEGGTASGFFTGGTGVTVYRGDAFPAEFRGNLFVADVANNIVHRAVPVADGLQVQARSAEEGREFLASRDNAFRPVQMASGPDGCLWVIDMCRTLIEGAAFLPPQILKHVDVGGGVDRGRIWRVVPEGYAARWPKLAKATTAELVALLDHPNGWHRDTAARLLHQRQDRAAVAPLRRLAAEATSPQGRVQALYALESLGALEPGAVLAALGDAEPWVRIHALRLAEPLGAGAKDEAVAARMEIMAADPELLVRYQLAFSLGAVPGTRPAAALAALAVRDGANPWVRVALLSSVSDCAGAVFAALAQDPGFRGAKHGRDFLAALVSQSDLANRREDLAPVLAALDGPLAGDEPLARTIVLALMGRMSAGASARARLSGPDSGRVGAILGAILAEARATAVDAGKRTPARVEAARALRFAPFDEVRPLLADLLASRQPPEVQAAAVETLARSDDDRVPAILLDAWPGLTPKLRATAAEALFGRRRWLGAFLDAVEGGKVGRGDVDPARLELLKTYPDPDVKARAAGLFAAGLPRRQEVVAAYQGALAMRGDRERGKAVFRTHCASCHRLEGYGSQVGADLAAIRDRGLESVLLNILDPNREVKPQYQSYVVVTTAGRVLTGMITAETANSLTLRKPDGGEESVLRLDVDEMRGTGLSFMPEGLEKAIDPAAMADLLAYLNTVR